MRQSRREFIASLLAAVTAPSCGISAIPAPVDVGVPVGAMHLHIGGQRPGKAYAMALSLRNNLNAIVGESREGVTVFTGAREYLEREFPQMLEDDWDAANDRLS